MPDAMTGELAPETCAPGGAHRFNTSGRLVEKTIRGWLGQPCWFASRSRSAEWRSGLTPPASAWTPGTRSNRASCLSHALSAHS